MRPKSSILHVLLSRIWKIIEGFQVRINLGHWVCTKSLSWKSIDFQIKHWQPTSEVQPCNWRLIPTLLIQGLPISKVKIKEIRAIIGKDGSYKRKI